MTLSAPSLFAAAARASTPPSAWALVAGAAEAPPLLPAPLDVLELLDGGEQAETAARAAVTAARAAVVAARRRGRAAAASGGIRRMWGPFTSGPGGPEGAARSATAVTVGPRGVPLAVTWASLA